MNCRREDRDGADALLVCVRGTVGCGLEHGPWPEVSRASGIAACISTGMGESDDFEGAVE